MLSFRNISILDLYNAIKVYYNISGPGKGYIRKRGYTR